MADFKKAISDTLAWEGGHSNNPDDPGGDTNYGITLKVAMANGWKGKSMKDFPFDLALEIYRKRYWEPLCLDYIIDQKIASQLLQAAVNQGVVRWQFYVQKAANVLLPKDRELAVDGVMGNMTVNAINYLIENGYKVPLSKEIFNQQEERYDVLVEKMPRLKWARNGWHNRAKSFLCKG